MKKSFWAFLILFSLFNFSIFAQEKEVTTITILNARTTDYKKNEETKNEVIILEGDVSLSVKKGESTTEINASTVTYDRQTQMLYASGYVQIKTKSEAEGEQTTTATSLIMNTSTLEGVFDGGKVIQTQSDAINLPSGSTLVVFSDLFGKSQNNTIVFKNSSLTFCDDENPHWHIDATRTWLLPGGEFAFFNALLYVGPVPVLYFPAFYYPKDELIFNPVFGFRQREGYYFQTTTYLFGRKALENSSSDSSSSDDSLKSIYNFMKSSTLKEQERQGLILHNLDKNFTGDTTNYVKLLADWYSSLGGMIGIDANLQPKKFPFISSLNFNLALAFNNEINSQTNISANNLQETNFLGLKLPFRYSANLAVSINKPFELSLSFPIYSDPYYSYDFENRTENMDWFTMLSTFGNEETSTTSSVSSLTWKLNTAYTIPLSNKIKPYLSSARFSTSSLINISAKQNYYIPSSVTPLSIESSFSGTLFSYPKKVESKKEEYMFSLIMPQSEDDNQTTQETQQEGTNTQNSVEEENTQNELELFYPEISPSYKKYDLPDKINYDLSYSLNATFVSNIAYATEKLNTIEDFKWKDIKSWMYTIKTPLNIKSDFSYGQSLITLNNTLSYSPIWQTHPSTKGYDNKTELDSLLLSDYKAQSQNVINTNSLSIKPFSYIPQFSATSVTYNSTINMFRRVFTGTGDDPTWEYYGPDWTDSESVTVHNLNLNFSWNQQNNKFSQSFIFSSTLYPQVPKYSGTFNFNFPYVTLGFSSSIQEKSKTDTSIQKNPFNQNLKVSLLDSKLNFNQSLSYSLEENHFESINFSLSYKNFSSSYIMQYTNPYDFTPNGWVSKSEKKLIPYSLSVSYNTSSKTYYSWFNRISVAPSLSTSLVADFVRPTNSYFVFSPGITFKINEFFNISFSSTSRNSVLYRYIQKGLGFDGRIPGEQNIFKDLFNSYRFDDKSLREASGFKLKSLNMKIEHELHDWSFFMTMKFEPRLITKDNKTTYDYSPYISIGVIWKPMEALSTKITDEYGKWIME